MVMRKYRFHLAFGSACGIGAVLLTWLLGSESLAHTSLSVPSAFSDFIGLINIVPYFLSAILSGSDFGDARGEFAYWALVFIQWAGVGLCIAALTSLSKDHNVHA